MPICSPEPFLHSEFLIFQIFIWYFQGMRNSCIWEGSFGYSCYRQDTKNVHVSKSCCLRSSAHTDGDYKLEADSWISSSKLIYLVDHYSHGPRSSSSGGNNVTAHARYVLPAKLSPHNGTQKMKLFESGTVNMNVNIDLSGFHRLLPGNLGCWSLLYSNISWVKKR